MFSNYYVVQPFENCIHLNYTYRFISYVMENMIHLHYITHLLMLYITLPMVLLSLC